MHQTEANARDSHRRRFQYSLRSLLIVTTVLAVACAVFFAFPVWVGIIALLCMVFFTPVVLTIVLIHRPGYLRTFCTGALFPAGICFIVCGIYIFIVFLTFVFDGGPSFSPDEGRRIEVLIFLGAYCVLVILGGLLAVFVRWRLEAPQRRAARESRAAEEAPNTSEMDLNGGNISTERR